MMVYTSQPLLHECQLFRNRASANVSIANPIDLTTLASLLLNTDQSVLTQAAHRKEALKSYPVDPC